MVPFSGFALFLALLGGSTYASTPLRLESTDYFSAKIVSIDLSKPARGTVVAFLSANCPCSKSHEDTLENLRKKFESLGFRFVGIHSNQNESPTLATEHFQKSPLRFPVLSDTDARWADAFGALKTPHVFVTSPTGAVLYQGGVDDSHSPLTAKKQFLADALTAISDGKAPSVPQARALGCIISRKK